MSSGGVSKNPILKQAFSEEGVDIKVLVDEQQRIIQAQRAQLARFNNLDAKRRIMRDLLKEIGDILTASEETRSDPAIDEFGDYRMLPAYSGAWVRLSMMTARDLLRKIENVKVASNMGGAEKGGRG